MCGDANCASYNKNLRNEFSSPRIEIKNITEDPIKQFEKWMEDAVNKKTYLPNAMRLATTPSSGNPSGRIVLLREFDERVLSFLLIITAEKQLN